ncbi:thioredoxin domain-containing protein [Roseiconus nitratireducens]|uniref:thioredoxin domain-containing protein n=1 Tax=Roseiconus nitratireducens TaxID=2605748 RepID=UPI001375B63D|nr:thioredoxin domain-containing protein [Roseiconus nitratireducens]
MHDPNTDEPAHTNRLAKETSPYLLQHAHNPVDWYPWSDEAFEKAKREDKPIFLSVGYSTCYWCHVMEVESFEDPEVAAVINEHFVPIKVDREERPDLDEQYMIATQLMTQRGGWPNSVWLTPDGRPWMAGTYFPKQRFIAVLKQLDEVWKNRRDDVQKQADMLAKAAERLGESGFEERPELSAALVGEATAQLAAGYDEVHGGFGGAPKFPPHGTLQLLIEQYRVTEDASLLPPVTQTLDAMWLGGIHDHLGGGFHRYATDREWLLPHFEKMLYDNAQLMRAYADGFALTREPRYRDAVADIDRWLRQEMTSPQGAFYSAIDSGEVGKEGEAYVWPIERLSEVLTPEQAELFAEIYQFRPEGNFREESTGEQTGTNIPHLEASIETIAEQRKTDPAALRKRLAAIRSALLVERNTWPQPHKDDKVLTSWNGLMIGSLAYAGRLLDEPRYIRSAERAAEFILDQMVRDGVLLRTYRDGTAKLPGYLDDHAYFADALLQLYRATGDERWLSQATALADRLLADFEDRQDGGFFFTTDDHEVLLVRSKHLGGGGNLPNPNGVAANVLIELSELTGNPAYRESAERTLRSLAGRMKQQPFTCEDLLVATSRWLATRAEDGTGAAGTMTADAESDRLERRVGPLRIRVSSTATKVRVDETFIVTAVIDIDEAWHLYAANPEAPFVQPSDIEVEESKSLVIGETQRPEGERRVDESLDQAINAYTGKIEFAVPVTVRPEAVDGEIKVTVRVTTQACDDRRCLPVEVSSFQVPVTIVSGGERDRPRD